MTRIGVSGHMNLTAATESLVYRELYELLSVEPAAELVGISCLARGADQLFARAVVNVGGQLIVILPSANYRQQKVHPDNQATFDELIGKAVQIRTLPFTTANRAAYEAANNLLLDLAELLVAVWDGQPSADQGGTSTLVERASQLGKPVRVIWPERAERIAT
jgi:hypothetical protein